MQPMQSAQRGNPVWRYGLIFGGIIAVLDIINSVISAVNGSDTSAFSTTSGQASISNGLLGLGCLFALVSLALYFVAGMLASSKTGKAGTGSLAGLVAGAVGGVVGLIAGVVRLLSIPASSFQSIADRTQTTGGTPLTAQQVQSAVVVVGIVVAVIGLLVAIGIGAGPWCARRPRGAWTGAAPAIRGSDVSGHGAGLPAGARISRAAAGCIPAAGLSTTGLPTAGAVSAAATPAPIVAAVVSGRKGACK